MQPMHTLAVLFCGAAAGMLAAGFGWPLGAAAVSGRVPVDG